MSSKESRWGRILEAMRLKSPPKQSYRDYRLEELMATTRGGKTGPSERVEPSETLLKRCEMLYRLDPIIFSGVNRLTRRITGSKIYFQGGEKEENEKAFQFLVASKTLQLLPLLTKDAFIYGFGAAEINTKDNITTLTQIDPKQLDFQREVSKTDQSTGIKEIALDSQGRVKESTGIKEIALDPQGRVKGFVWKKSVGNEVKLKASEVLLIRFYTLGEYCLGISPIEPAFKTAWIKLNLEESLGEAIYRHGFPLFKFKIGTPEPGPWHEITPEKIKDARKILRTLDPSSELILPWWIDAEVIMKRSEIGNITMFLENLAAQIYAALEVPKAMATEAIDFEKTILSFQEELSRQVYEQLLEPYYKTTHFQSKPHMTFSAYAPELQNMQLRRISAYAKNGLLTRTDELENELRRQEGFPLKAVPEKANVECVLGLGECPVRKIENLPLDKLQAYCNICLIRMKAQNKITRASLKKSKKAGEEDVGEVKG